MPTTRTCKEKIGLNYLQQIRIHLFIRLFIIGHREHRLMILIKVIHLKQNMFRHWQIFRKIDSAFHEMKCRCVQPIQFTHDSKIKIYNLPFKIPLSFCVLQIRKFYKYIIVTCSNLVGLIVSHHFRDNRVRISFQSTWTPLP